MIDFMQSYTNVAYNTQIIVIAPLNKEKGVLHMFIMEYFSVFNYRKVHTYTVPVIILKNLSVSHYL